MATVFARLAAPLQRAHLRPQMDPTGRLARAGHQFLASNIASSRRLLSASGILQQSNPAPPMGRFTYNVAASYIGKGRPFDPSTHVFHFNPYNRITHTRHTHLRPESGQDAFFASRIGETGGVAVGVADGVGGWEESGVDPAHFSHGICDYMASAAYDFGKPSPDTPTVQLPPLTARQLLQRGFEDVIHDKAIKAGGSTAVVGLLLPNGTLEVANLGDSGYIHLRANAVHAYSEPQTHAFNTPYQLALIPQSMLARMARFGGVQIQDLPRDADVTRHDLQHGDVVVFATDGVWDNLFNQDILRIVAEKMAAAGAWVGGDAGVQVAPSLLPMTDPENVSGPDAAPQAAAAAAGGGKGASSKKAISSLQSQIATGIVAVAKANSMNAKKDGPFAKAVQESMQYERWHGGKVDDIAVVVAIVSETKEAPIKSRL